LRALHRYGVDNTVMAREEVDGAFAHTVDEGSKDKENRTYRSKRAVIVVRNKDLFHEKIN